MAFKVTLYEVRKSSIELKNYYYCELTSFEFPDLQEAKLFAELCRNKSIMPLRITIDAESLNVAAEEFIEEMKNE